MGQSVSDYTVPGNNRGHEWFLHTYYTGTQIAIQLIFQLLQKMIIAF